jgi:hypothetical protein
MQNKTTEKNKEEDGSCSEASSVDIKDDGGFTFLNMNQLI